MTRGLQVHHVINFSGQIPSKCWLVYVSSYIYSFTVSLDYLWNLMKDLCNSFDRTKQWHLKGFLIEVPFALTPGVNGFKSVTLNGSKYKPVVKYVALFQFDVGVSSFFFSFLWSHYHFCYLQHSRPCIVSSYTLFLSSFFVHLIPSNNKSCFMLLFFKVKAYHLFSVILLIYSYYTVNHFIHFDLFFYVLLYISFLK